MVTRLRVAGVKIVQTRLTVGASVSFRADTPVTPPTEIFAVQTSDSALISAECFAVEGD